MNASGSWRWRTGLALAVVGAGLSFGCSGGLPKGQTAEASDALVLGAPVEVDSRGIDAAALLGSTAEGLVSEGASGLQVVAAEAAAEGDRVGGFVQVRADACLIAYARGTGSVEDLDILVFDDAGESLMADQAVSPSPAVVVCPPHAGRMYVTARVASGQGLVALGVQAVEPSRAAAMAIRLGARMSAREGEMLRQEAWPGLAGRVEQRRSELAGRWVELRRLSVPVSQRAPTYVSVPLPGSRCLDVLVVPNEEVRGLQVTVADDRGAVIARGADRGEERVALVCSPTDTTISVEVRPRRGHGMAAVVLSRSEAGAETELAVRPDARRGGPMLPLEDVSRRVTSLLATGKQGRAKEVGRGPLRMGGTVLHRHRAAAGCTRFDVLAGAPLTSLRAALWQGDALWARAEGGEQTTLFGCVDQATDVELEVEGQGQPGEHLVEARWEGDVPVALRAHPVAAARLLGRLNAGGEVTPASAVTDVRVVDVDQEHRHTQSVAVPAGSCRTWVASLGPGASGLSVLALAGREVVARGHGGEVATARLCASEGPLRAELRLTVGAGRTQALVGLVDR